MSKIELLELFQKGLNDGVQKFHDLKNPGKKQPDQNQEDDPEQQIDESDQAA
jgi:hypothetical protein